MNIQDVILGFLCEKPMSGYDIKQMMEKSVSYFFDATFGAIYPALRKMEKEGLVEKQVIQQEGKPNKNLFVITESGREQFQKYLNSPINPTVTRSDILIRLFFGKLSTKENVQIWLEEERQKNEEMYESLEKVSSEFPNMDKHQRLVLEYGIRLSKMVMELIDEELNREG